MSKIPYIEVEENDYYQFGIKIGKSLSSEISSRIESNIADYRKKFQDNFSRISSIASILISDVKITYPDTYQEICGIAKGASVNLDSLSMVICEEDLFYIGIPKCTTVGVLAKENNVLVGHNEDWLKSYIENGLYVINANIKGESFLALSYMGSLPSTSCGLNKYGIAITGNSI